MLSGRTYVHEKDSAKLLLDKNHLQPNSHKVPSHPIGSLHVGEYIGRLTDVHLGKRAIRPKKLQSVSRGLVT